ncbi:alginate O-acetyltransferase AlgX-related protein [Flavobacterium sp.]|uniref:alginate O-acetyltransferase AlgX-related protein n=1 Tax=Flavobacterium sp. TaxID=239 RepID=UPI00286EACDE|nr:hypothetical protein [Flavobacterium sp.]
MYIKNIFLVIVSVILLSPTLLFFSNTNRDENGNSENQAPLAFNSKKPFEMFDNYYKYNFAFRTMLSKQYIRLKSDLVKVSSLPDKVVIGKKGWYFLGNSYNNVFSESLGVENYPKEEIDKISNTILEMNRFCDSLGVKFYYFPAPNSHSIYKEFLPVKPNTKPRRLDLLMDNLKDKVEIIDVRQNLIAAKSKNRLYHKTDTHWNNFGAFIGTQELIKQIKTDFPDTQLLDMNNYDIKTNTVNQMDLTKMITIKVTENVYDFAYKKGKEQPKSIIKMDTIDRIPVLVSKNKAKKLKGVMYRDSFAGSMIPFLNTIFGDMTYLSTSKFDKQRIIAEKPDFVVFEVVERDLVWTEFK